MKKSTFALYGLLCCFGTVSAAQDKTMTGFYATGGISLTSNALSYDRHYSSTDTTYTNTNITTHDQSGIGYQLGIGYRFTENSALEIITLRAPKTKRTYDYRNTDITTGTVTTSSDDDFIQDTSIAFTWLYGVPVSQRLNPYARAGVTLTYSETDDNYSSGTYSSTSKSAGFNTGYLVGLGNDMYFSEEKRTALRTELMIRTNDGTYSSGSLSLATGIVWNF